MSNNHKELEKILKKLNSDIAKNQFNIQLNEKIIQIIINIYKSAKEFNITRLTFLIEEIKIIYWISDLDEYGSNNTNNDSSDKSWDEDIDENMIFEHIESITWNFLKNLKKYNENK